MSYLAYLTSFFAVGPVWRERKKERERERKRVREKRERERENRRQEYEVGSREPALAVYREQLE